ncbi:hypothetical protein FQZ97_823270 [compost metagenome]
MPEEGQGHGQVAHRALLQHADRFIAPHAVDHLFRVVVALGSELVDQDGVPRSGLGVEAHGQVRAACANGFDVRLPEAGEPAVEPLPAPAAFELVAVGLTEPRSVDEPAVDGRAFLVDQANDFVVGHVVERGPAVQDQSPPIRDAHAVELQVVADHPGRHDHRQPQAHGQPPGGDPTH